MKIKCLIVDDEELALDVLAEFVDRIDFLQLEGRCTNAIDAITVLNRKNIDLIFLDIQMPQLTGLQLLRNFSNLPQVIITTAYPNFAIEGFELEVLDYLLKPIAFERFFKAVNRFIVQKSRFALALKESSANISKEGEFIFVKSDKQMIKVVLSNISYIESIRNYALIHLADKTQIRTLNTISNIENTIPENDFIRIHRSFIISINKIQTFTANSIQMEKKYIPIGRNYRNFVLKQLSKRGIC